MYNRKTIVHLENMSDQVLAAVKKHRINQECRISDNKLILDIDNPEQDNPEVVRAIVQAGGNIQYVTELRSTLEDVYLKLIREAKEQMRFWKSWIVTQKDLSVIKKKQVCFLFFNCPANNIGCYFTMQLSFLL